MRNKVLITLALTAILILFFRLAGEEQKGDDRDDFIVVESAQPVPADRNTGFTSINRQEALAHLGFLASDTLTGRETATTGYRTAAEYVATQFQLWGLYPGGDPGNGPFSGKDNRDEDRSFFQWVEMKEVTGSSSTMTVTYIRGARRETRRFMEDTDYIYYSRDDGSFTAPVVFAGYGIREKGLRFDEYAGLDLRGKIVMILSGIPEGTGKNNPFQNEKIKSKYVRSAGSRHRSNPKIQLAKERGALAVLLVESHPARKGDVARRTLKGREINDEGPMYPRDRRKLSLIDTVTAMPWETIPAIRISRQVADTLLDFADTSIEKLKQSIDQTLKPATRQLPGVTLTLENRVETQLVRCSNVIGMIEGSDPELKHEAVLIGAHLDHLGKRGDYIFNGADDNGSGSVAIMEIAEAFARNPHRPRRSIIFALWTGEEEGLLGSRYYAANPLVALEKTIACLNLDMVSRAWTTDNLMRINRRWRLGIDEKRISEIDAGKLITLAVDKAADPVQQALVASNQYLGQTLYMRRSESKRWGTDHAAFAMNNVPWAFFFAATTSDYHTPADSVARVDGALLERIARLVYLTAFQLAEN